MWNNDESQVKIHVEEIRWTLDKIKSYFPNIDSPEETMSPKVRYQIPLTLTVNKIEHHKSCTEFCPKIFNMNLSSSLDENDKLYFTVRFWFKFFDQAYDTKLVKSFNVKLHLTNDCGESICDAGTGDVVDASKKISSIKHYSWAFHFKTITIPEMFKKPDLYFPKETLHLKFEIVYLKINSTPGGHPEVDFLPKALGTLTNDVSSLFIGDGTDNNYVGSNSKYADLSIVCGDKKFSGHKCILSARCPVFARMLSTDMKEKASNTITIEDISPEIIELLLKYIYSSKLNVKELKEDELKELLDASDMYQLDEVKKTCFEQMLKNMDDDSIGDIAIKAYLHSADKYTRAVIYKYFHEKWKKLTKDVNFRNKVYGCPAAFVQPFD